MADARRVELNGDLLELWFPYNAEILDVVRALPKRRFVPVAEDPRGAHWTVPAIPAALEPIGLLAKRFGFTTVGLDELRERSNRTVAASRAVLTDDVIAIPGLSPNITLRPYQVTGLKYMLQVLERLPAAINGDHMGLGKTGLSLSTIAIKDAYPCLVVGLASGKYGWQKEVKKWFPGKTAMVLEGLKALPLSAYKADIIIANYDILRVDKEVNVRKDGKKYTRWFPKEGNHTEALLRVGLRSVIFDEVHAIKTHKSQRHNACKMLMDKVQVGLGLSGTPVENRQTELLSILSALNLADAFGGWYTLATKYCGFDGTMMGVTPVKNSTLQEWHQILRGTCYLRRLKTDKGVREHLPAKSPPIIIPVKLSAAAQKEYDRAERDIVAYLNEQGNLTIESRAEALRRLGVLRQIVGRGKVEAVNEWIDAFLESPGKVTVFADHIAVQDLLYQPRGTMAARIAGADSALKRQMHIDRFMEDPMCRVMVSSIKAGGTGVDGLQTACSTVAFAELYWNPSKLEQAEDRVFRDGQTEPVMVYYFIAQDTVDEDMLAIIDQKRIITSAVADGLSEDDLDAKGMLMGKSLDVALGVMSRLVEKHQKEFEL